MSAADLREAFRFASRGGVIADTRELLELLRNLGLNPTEKETLDILCKHDENDDGTIDEGEFVDVMSDKIQPFDTDEEIRRVFQVFDKDLSGSIDAEELRFAFRLVMHDAGGTCLEDMEKLIDDLDKDGDGRINYEEFLQATDMTTSPEQRCHGNQDVPTTPEFTGHNSHNIEVLQP